MARFNSVGMGPILEDIVRENKATPETVKKMVEAGGDVMVEETRNQVMLYGLVDKGITLKSIKKGKIGKRGDGYSLEVWPAGRRVDKKHPKGERIETIAFVSEYGWNPSGGPVAARPFMATAFKVAPDLVQAAMLDVWERDNQ